MGGAAKHLQTEEDKSSSQNFTEEIPQDSDHLQKFHIWKYYLSFTVQGNKYMICMQKSHVLLQIAMQKSQSSIELS